MKDFWQAGLQHEQRQRRTGTGQVDGAFQPLVSSHHQTLPWLASGGNLGNIRLSYILTMTFLWG